MVGRDSSPHPRVRRLRPGHLGARDEIRRLRQRAKVRRRPEEESSPGHARADAGGLASGRSRRAAVHRLRRRSAGRSVPAGAVGGRRADGTPLPEPLPEAPRPPLSYLVALGDKVRSQDPLSIDEQLAIVGTIRTALAHPEDIDGADDLDAAERLLKDLRRRRDVYARVAEEIDQALAQAASVRRELFAPEPETTAPSLEPQVARPAVAYPPVATPAPAPATEAQPAATSTSATAAAVDIKPHWVMAIVSAVLFLFTGIFAIINAARVRPALERGDTAAAEKASGRVKLYFWISVALFVLVLIIASAGGE